MEFYLERNAHIDLLSVMWKYGKYHWLCSIKAQYRYTWLTVMDMNLIIWSYGSEKVNKPYHISISRLYCGNYHIIVVDIQSWLEIWYYLNAHMFQNALCLLSDFLFKCFQLHLFAYGFDIAEYLF